MTAVLAYVDATLARQLATGLIGSEVKLSEVQGATFGVNFRVILSHDRKVEQATTTRTSELLPELLADAIHTATREKIDSLETARSRLVAGSERSFRPGTAVTLSNANFSLDGKVRTSLSGEDLLLYRLKVGEFFVHSFVPESAEKMFDSLAGQPVEVSGLLRFTPPYPVPGALSLSLGLRICAVWLR